MELTQLLMHIRDAIKKGDPEAQHYTTSDKTRDAFTVWGEYEAFGLSADDGYVEQGWRFEVDHYTRTEFSPVAAQILAALRSDPGITVSYSVAYDYSTGYIRHVFDCEGC